MSVHDARNVADPPARRREAALAGHQGDISAARGALGDDDPGVRATALAALTRLGAVTEAEISAALGDGAPQVRARACEVAASSGLGAGAVVGLLADADPSVVEVASWALGELGERAPLPASAILSLAQIATSHEDALAREAAVAALGALGDVLGLPAILVATKDKPAVRRRAVLALAPFDGPEVDEALERARQDRDWQVRDAAELLLRDD
ncbi:MAG: HEAT repeat domain-containing protein [Acidimicrobiales bacterium]